VGNDNHFNENTKHQLDKHVKFVARCGISNFSGFERILSATTY